LQLDTRSAGEWRMTTRKKLSIAGVLLVVSACLGGFCLVFESKSGISKVSYECVKIGMSLEDVESIFGTSGSEMTNFGITTDDRHVIWMNRFFDHAYVRFVNNSVVEKDWRYSSLTTTQRVLHMFSNLFRNG
jgi:hypothetical protein